MNKLTKRLSTLLLIILFAVVLSGCGSKTASYTVSLEIWGSFDDPDSFFESFNNYRKMNKSVKDVAYRKLTADQYREDLIDALAAGNGPDMFFIHSSWLEDFKDKIAPAPARLVSELDLRANFPDVVFDDFFRDGSIYALPMSIDSLALYYNKDIFNSAGLVSLPENWDQFQEIARRLTKVNENGIIQLSGVAMGTSSNVNRPTDVLTALMMQYGIDFGSGRGLSSSTTSIDGKSSSMPGPDALEFYTRFAQLNADVYCWNKNMPYSVDAFSEGRAAMMINYSWQVEAIKKKNPKLNFAVVPLPQKNAGSKKNIANYWALAVAKDKVSVQPNRQAVSNEVFESWQLIKFLTMNNKGTFNLMSSAAKEAVPIAVQFDPELDYLKKTGKPAARKDVIESQLKDPELYPFAQGNLVAESWSQKDPIRTESILIEMIDSVNVGRLTPTAAISVAQNRIGKLEGR